MEKQEKKGSKKAAALALGLALALTVGMTSAYLADSSELITNEFDPEWVFTDVEESGDQQYDIVPGTEETKDPKVKVNNSVDAYVYLIVTDKVNANGQVVDYTIDPMWTEISNLPETIYDGEGNPITLTEYDKVYYTVAPKTADGETSEVRDDFELVYPVLVGDKVSYPSSLTNSDLEGIEDPDNILSFKSYAIQKDPFVSAIDALQQTETADDPTVDPTDDPDDPTVDPTEDTALAEAKTNAKNAISNEAGDNPSPEVQAIVDEYNKADGTIDAQTSVADVEAKKQEAIDKINQQKAQEEAEKELADAKTSAKAAIEAAVCENPSEAETKAANDAKAAIDAATTPEEVTTAKTDGLAAIKAADDAHKLADAKTDAKEAIDEATSSNPSPAVQAAAEAAKAAIDNATTPEEVEAAKTAGITAIEAAKAAELAAAKTAAKTALLEKLNSYDKEVADYDHGNDAQNQAYADAIAAIDNATTPEAVEAAKTAGITAIEEAATPAPTIADINKELKEQGKTFEIAELAGYKIWNDAMAYAEEKGGRLATLAELQAIYNIDKDMSPRPIYSEMTGNKRAWTSEKSATKLARDVGFDNGHDYSNDTKTLNYFVVVVRDLATSSN